MVMLDVRPRTHSYQKVRRWHSLGQVADGGLDGWRGRFFLKITCPAGQSIAFQTRAREIVAGAYPKVDVYCPAGFSILLATLTPLSPPAYRDTPR